MRRTVLGSGLVAAMVSVGCIDTFRRDPYGWQDNSYLQNQPPRYGHGGTQSPTAAPGGNRLPAARTGAAIAVFADPGRDGLFTRGPCADHPPERGHAAGVRRWPAGGAIDSDTRSWAIGAGAQHGHGRRHRAVARA
jgi:hypothetical protein